MRLVLSFNHQSNDLRLSSIIDSIDLFRPQRSATELQNELSTCSNFIQDLLARPIHFNGIRAQRESLSRDCREAAELVSEALANPKSSIGTVPRSFSTSALTKRGPIKSKTRIPVRLSLQSADASSRSSSRLSMMSTSSHRSITPTPMRDVSKKLPALEPRRPSLARPESASSIKIAAKRQIDIAVADIITKLSTEGHKHLHVQAADGENISTNASGRFMIGGRLYFCRILRSTAVMVRVGGGWESLDTFLRTHFVHDLDSGQLTRSISSQTSLSAISSPLIARSLSASFRMGTPDGGSDLTGSDVLHTPLKESVKASPPSVMRWQ